MKQQDNHDPHASASPLHGFEAMAQALQEAAAQAEADAAKLHYSVHGRALADKAKRWRAILAANGPSAVGDAGITHAPNAGFVERLAAEIRRVDGKHELGAAALAEALAPFVAAEAARGLPGAFEPYTWGYTNIVNGDKGITPVRWQRQLEHYTEHALIAVPPTGDSVAFAALCRSVVEARTEEEEHAACKAIATFLNDDLDRALHSGTKKEHAS